jgi:YARHG domain
MGFPILADEIAGERVEFDPHFQTWVNGKEVKITKKRGIPHPVKDYPYFSDAVYTYPITFSQNETVKIKHHYAVGGTFDSMGGWNFTYILRTGALWKGTIEDFKLIFKTQASTVHEIYNTEPKEQVRERHGQEMHLVWNFTNYKPQNDFKVFGNYKRQAPTVENVPSPDKVSVMLIEYYKDKKYEGDKRLYTTSDILYNLNAAERASLNNNMIRLNAKTLRNEIYARHGRVFSTPEMKQIFESAPWYKPNSGFKESELNDIEKKNLGFILAFEKKNGSK